MGAPSAAPAGTPKPLGRRPWVLGLLLALLGVGVFFSPLLGTVTIAPETVLRYLLHQVSGGALYSNPCAGASVPASGCTGLIQIVWDARLSEIMLAVVVGAGLGISGGTLQGVFRNPLADPGDPEAGSDDHGQHDFRESSVPDDLDRPVQPLGRHARLRGWSRGPLPDLVEKD